MKKRLTLIILALMSFTACASAPGPQDNPETANTPNKQVTLVGTLDLSVFPETYLVGQSVDYLKEREESPKCRSLTKIAGRSPYPYFSTAYLLEEKIKNAVGMYMDADEFERLIANLDVFFEEQKNKDNHDSAIFMDQICKTEEGIFLNFQTNSPARFLALWDGERMQLFLDENGNVFYHHNYFFAQALDGQSLSAFYGGDLIQRMWRFYLLDTDTMSAKLIEDCEAIQDDQNKWNRTCKVEYGKP